MVPSSCGLDCLYLLPKKRSLKTEKFQKAIVVPIGIFCICCGTINIVEGVMKQLLCISLVGFLLALASSSWAAEVVPPVVDLPGTQPREVGTFESPNRCDNCHGGYDTRVYSPAPAFGWKGSAMGNAGRDPIFWATLAIAEQDFDGVGDLCIRCHSAGGWIAGRSTPTDGSGLQQGDQHGIDCDTCHLSTNPDNSEHLGEMFPPFVANNGTEGFYGSGMLSLWGGNEKLGPYTKADATAKHQRMQSLFHRSNDFCGTCHDVSNSVTGHFAPNHGAQDGAVANVITNGSEIHPDTDTITNVQEAYVGLNNPPYAYGIVERTFSEYKASAFDGMLISNFENLPTELQATGGAIELAANSSAGPTYDDGSARYFNCQSCHMRPIVGVGANKAGTKSRSDLPVHDLTGGNHWMYPLIEYQDNNGILRMGGGLNATQIAAMDAGIIRAENSLKSTVSMEVTGNDLRITNLSAHKAITGYPEGRRMWLNIIWYDDNGAIVREDGEYGPLPVEPVTYIDSDGNSKSFTPKSLLDLHDPNTKIYEAHYAVSQEWAATLMTVNAAHYGPIPLSYDRLTGAPEMTIGELAGRDPEFYPYHETLHFALNNKVVSDNRIPPYGMSYDTCEVRNCLPVPADQYGAPGPGGTYNHFDVVSLTPPPDATHADIILNYQGTSWEYIQFLWLANTTPAGDFLGNEGVNMLDAWVNAKDKNGDSMVKPLEIARATWGTPQTCVPTGNPDTNCDGVDDDCNGTADDGYVPTGTSCGVGECAASGQLVCQDGLEVDTCIEGIPGLEDIATADTCSDTLDNDCDGLSDANDPGCQMVLDCTTYVDRATCVADPTCRWNRKRGCLNR